MTTEVYKEAGKIFITLYSNESYNEELESVLRDAISLLESIGPMDVRLAFKFGGAVNERINSWGLHIESMAQGNELSEGGRHKLETLALLSKKIGYILDSIYKDHGGKELEKGRDMVRGSIGMNGLLRLDKAEDLLMGIKSMVQGLQDLSEVDIYGACREALELKYFMECVLHAHATEPIIEFWNQASSRINSVLSQSMLGFYPDLNAGMEDE